MSNVEAVRAQFRPERITTLFVGESAPHSGAFFYLGNTGMRRHFQSAVEAALGSAGVHRAFVNALPRSLSLFNGGEANPVSIEKTGYSFRIAFVPQSSPEIERTAVGKVPLVRDRG